EVRQEELARLQQEARTEVCRVLQQEEVPPLPLLSTDPGRGWLSVALHLRDPELSRLLADVEPAYPCLGLFLRELEDPGWWRPQLDSPAVPERSSWQSPEGQAPAEEAKDEAAVPEEPPSLPQARE